jgi:hypothetical protein
MNKITLIILVNIVIIAGVSGVFISATLLTNPQVGAPGMAICDYTSKMPLSPADRAANNQYIKENYNVVCP